MSDPVWDAAGAEIAGQASTGAEFITTYGIPAAGVLLLAGFAWAMFIKLGKRNRSAA